MKLKSLSVFFPCFNDEKNIAQLIVKTYKILPEIAGKYEVIVVNDGSTDNSLKVLTSLQKRYSTLRIINHKTNLGYGKTLISGFENARKEWVFYTDGDGQYDPEELIKLVSKTEKGIEVVNGYKIKRADNLHRRVLGSLYNKILHLLYEIPISDVDCDFRLIKKSLFKGIKLKATSALICLELILKLKKKGARFKEIPVHHHPRTFGKSQFFSVKNLVKSFTENLQFYFQHKDNFPN